MTINTNGDFCLRAAGFIYIDESNDKSTIQDLKFRLSSRNPSAKAPRQRANQVAYSASQQELKITSIREAL